VYTLTEVLSVRVKENLKDEAEKLGVDLKVVVEELLEDLVTKFYIFLLIFLFFLRIFVCIDRKENSISY
jgi:hypothetical protein